MKLKLRNLDLKFTEDGHVYELGGKLLTGVTTILGILDKPFLKWWTVKLMYETLLPKLQDVQGITKKEWDDILTEAKKAHTIKTKEGASIGKEAHNWIETYIKAKIENTVAPASPQDEKVYSSVQAFLKWEAEHKIEWLASEIPLASVIHTFAGTVDAVAIVDGKLSIIDFKTSNQMSDAYGLQTAAYCILLNENLEGEERPEQRIIVRIPKDGSGFEAMILDIDLGFEVDTFLKLREVYKWTIYVENRKGQRIN
ncbi:MAG: PD-(D/E)XK nuclease family protein [Patescibacteria group bacterium]|nr:PD-(D/E)XK nuclease family protein [Patescibacteria group bacterium]